MGQLNNMPDSRINILIGYFDYQVLASYRNEPDKYTIVNDSFEGHLSLTKNYYTQIVADNTKDDFDIDVRFGYRTLNNGKLAVAAWLPDLKKCSKKDIQIWMGFHIDNPQWITGNDECFNLWYRRNFECDYDVDNGPLFYLGKVIQTINALTNEAVGKSLFKYVPNKTLSYPEAENTKEYQVAHVKLYPYIVDSLDKNCINAIALKMGKSINVSDKTTVNSLYKIFPQLENSKYFKNSIDLVSDKRRKTFHSTEQPAVNCPAFEQFKKDLELCVLGLRELLSILEKDFGMNGEEASERYAAKNRLPHISSPSYCDKTIDDISQMNGKTITKIEYGFREDRNDEHKSEVIIIHFTDGSIIGIDTILDGIQLLNEKTDLKPEDFRVDFITNWVPPKNEHGEK